METREWDEIDCKLPKVGVQLSREPKTACDATHGSRDEVIEITNCYETTEHNKKYKGQWSAMLSHMYYNDIFPVIEKQM